MFSRSCFALKNICARLDVAGFLPFAEVPMVNAGVPFRVMSTLPIEDFDSYAPAPGWKEARFTSSIKHSSVFEVSANLVDGANVHRGLPFPTDPTDFTEFAEGSYIPGPGPRGLVIYDPKEG